MSDVKCYLTHPDVKGAEGTDMEASLSVKTTNILLPLTLDFCALESEEFFLCNLMANVLDQIV